MFRYTTRTQRQAPGQQVVNGKFSFYLLPFTFSLLLSGCLVGPDYEKPEVDVPEEYRFQITDGVDSANTAWWDRFNDPQLYDLIDEALRNNRDVRIAAARIEEFAAVVDINRSGLYPQFGYGGDASRTKSSLDTVGGLPAGIERTNDLYNASINVGWELDFWGKIRRSTEAARANLLAQEEARRSVILTLVSTVTTSYIDLLSLDEQLKVARQTIKARKDSLDLFELKFKGGVVSELEVSQIRSEYEQAAVRIPSIERQVALRENALSILLGRNPGPIKRSPSIDLLTLPDIPAGLPSKLLERRPDIRQAEQNLVAANAQIGVAKAEYFPSISLTGLFGYASTALSELFDDTANLWNVGGDILGPIFTGGRLSGQLRASEAVQRQLLQSYLLSIQTAFREVDDALISTRKYREELAAQGRQLDALREYARLAQLNYDEGQVSYIEVLDSQRQLFDAELIYTQTQGLVFASIVAAYKALGGGWVEEAEAVANEVDFPPEDKQK